MKAHLAGADSSTVDTSIASVSHDRKMLLPSVIEFLDHFDDALRIVVNCARKTELSRWDYLFSYAGSPVELFEKCVEADDLRTAASYLLVLHSLESAEQSTALTVRLLRRAANQRKWALCGDLLRFLRSVDESGTMVRDAILQAALLDGVSADVAASTPSAKNGYHLDAATPTMATATKLDSPSIHINFTPMLNRTTSAPSTLDPTEEEEEEEIGEENGVQHALDYGSPRRNASFGEGTTLDAPGAAGAGAQSQRIRVQRRVSVPVRQSDAKGESHGSPSSTGARLLRAASPLSNAVSGLGMSLSKVGLRSTDRLSSPGQTSSNNLLSPMTGPGRSRSPGAIRSASPTRTVEAFIIE